MRPSEASVALPSSSGIYVCKYIYIYIYIYRERERENRRTRWRTARSVRPSEASVALPNTVEPIPTLGVLPPRGGPDQDPDLTRDATGATATGVPRS